MSKSEKRIEGTAENWETRRLGADEAFVAVSDVDEGLVDRAVGIEGGASDCMRMGRDTGCIQYRSAE